ncbi:MAG: hypothetical protein OXG64_07195 [Chloroflexi bacterium]|nr:hypothetical protein [Chloroflexota bacterium]
MIDDNAHNDSAARVIERHEFGTARWAIPKSSKCQHCGSGIEPGQGWERLEDAQGKEIVRHTTPLYFDECTDGETRKTLRRMGFCLVPARKGRADTEWLKQAGQEGWTVITTDERLMQVPEEKQAIVDNKVKCFILSPQPQGTWETLRAFVAMWEKIRSEASFPGPAVWRLSDESHASRWEQLLPSPADYLSIDFSRTPAGHLLNLFADVVKQHDAGWFTADFVNALHDAIRVELESRYIGAPARTPPSPTSQAWRESILDTHVNAEAGETKALDLDQPFNAAEAQLLVMVMRDDRGPHYQWIIPGHKIRPTTSEDFDPHRSYVFNAGSRGFRRSGIGLRLPEEN